MELGVPTACNDIDNDMHMSPMYLKISRNYENFFSKWCRKTVPMWIVRFVFTLTFACFNSLMVKTVNQLFLSKILCRNNYFLHWNFEEESWIVVLLWEKRVQNIQINILTESKFQHRTYFIFLHGCSRFGSSISTFV